MSAVRGAAHVNTTIDRRLPLAQAPVGGARPTAAQPQRLMATATTMPWPQQLLGCFGGKSASDAAPSTILREDSAHQRHHSGASSAMRTSDKSSAGASSDGLGPARMALSEPTPWHEPGRGSTRSASIQGAGGRRRDADAALQHAAQHRHSSRRSVSHGEPHSPLARSPDDWHCLRRFAFVGDISSSPAAGTVTKLMLNR